MRILIKNSHCFNIKENQDYTFIFDSQSNSSVFISNSLLAKLSKKVLEKREETVFLQIVNFPDNGNYSVENIEKGIYIRAEDEFREVFDC